MERKLMHPAMVGGVKKNYVWLRINANEYWIWQKRIGLFTLFSLLAFHSCTFRFVPEFSAELEQQIGDAAKMNDKLYLDMLADDSTKTTFSNYATRYSAVAAEINSIKLQNQLREKNESMLVIVNNLKDAFEKYQREHRARSAAPLTRGEIKVNQSTISGFWLPLLKAEAGLKKQKKF